MFVAREANEHVPVVVDPVSINHRRRIGTARGAQPFDPDTPAIRCDRVRVVVVRWRVPQTDDLGIGVAAHVDPDSVVLDQVLVGDDCIRVEDLDTRGERGTRRGTGGDRVAFEGSGSRCSVGQRGHRHSDLAVKFDGAVAEGDVPALDVQGTRGVLDGRPIDDRLEDRPTTRRARAEELDTLPVTRRRIGVGLIALDV